MDTDDEDILPPAFGDCYSPEKLFRSDDIVWVKYRKFYWPAVTKSICRKKKKLSIFFIDSPNHPGMCIPFGRAIAFNSVQGKSLQKQNVEPADLALLFEKTLKMVEDYLCKRVLNDCRLSPTKFFQNQSVPNVSRTHSETPESANEESNSQPFNENLLAQNLLAEESHSQSDEDDDSLPEEPQSQDSNPADPNNESSINKLEEPRETPENANEESNSQPFDENLLAQNLLAEESHSQSDEDDDSSPEEPQSQDSNPAEPNTNKLEEPHEARIKPLLKLIHSKPCRNHLLKILNGTKRCDRHTRFLSVTPSVRRQLKVDAGYDPIYETKDFLDEMESLKTLLEQSTSARFDVRSYLFDVWIPEATTWALSKHHKISLRKAKELFSQTCIQ